MKLYTEEQVLNTVKSIQVYIDKFGIAGAQPTINNHLKMLAPIELPSDEEINEVSKDEILYNHSKRSWWIEGAKYVINLIKQQNK